MSSEEKIAALALALERSGALITGAQAILESYLRPDGRNAIAALEALLSLLDGPEEREVQRESEKALKLALAPERVSGV